MQYAKEYFNKKYNCFCANSGFSSLRPCSVHGLTDNLILDIHGFFHAFSIWFVDPLNKFYISVIKAFIIMRYMTLRTKTQIHKKSNSTLSTPNASR